MSQTRKRLALALISGIIAAAAMAFYASSIQAEATQARQDALASYGGEQVEIYTALRDIAVGETLTSENVGLRTWLSDLLPNGALGAQGEVLGESVAVPLMRNEPVLAAKLGQLAAPVNVPEGLCAVSIPSEDVLAVGGAIRAGSFVSVYAADGVTVELIAEEVLILETSNSAQAASGNGSSLFGSSNSRSRLTWVTLAVEEDTAQELIAAARVRELHLVLPGGVSYE
ncbi:MAG: Flp pilus assembly protein CpaB [Coriobacteriales bacterium]|jgi:pilus assembly protein CpaB|nr:Flp pilus assembly protein CpaB [Coriobacteriales bacterium]